MSYRTFVELVAVLRVDAFALRKMEAAAQVLDPDCLLAKAFQVHFDARPSPVPESHVREAVKIKATAEFAIDPRQHVLVEARGHARCVIVSGMKSIFVLHQIKADQQRIAGLERPANAAQKLGCFFRLKVAYGGAKEEHQLASRQPLELWQEVGVVGYQRAHPQPREVAVQAGQCTLQRGRRNVHGIEVGAQLPPQESLDQYLRLAGAARAQLHQGEVVSRVQQHVTRVLPENGPLGPRWIIFRGLRDLVEQARAFLVVKKFGRKAALARSQSAQDFFRDGTDPDGRLFNCRHLPALCRRIASASPGGRSCDRWRECGSGAWRTSRRAGPSVRS